MGSLPPNSKTRRFKVLLQLSMIVLPVAEEPVIAHMATSGCCTRAPPTTPSPCTRLATPEGNTAMSASITFAPVIGATSDGLTTTVFPATSAGMASNKSSSAGKFQGAQIETTPCGCRITMLLPSFMTIGLLASTTRSMKSSLATAPPTSSIASASTLPISLTIVFASSSWLSASFLQASFKSAPLSAKLLSAHATCAAFARAITAPTSSALLTGTRPTTSPVAGSTTTILPSSMTTPCTMAPASASGRAHVRP
mmetsp:Transcript_78115/g.198510  ORF Transcript_78115/g.198510 Transcript_78115/m.198510 type:complete len:254 (+) Transcript_78115:882-1643(+)